MTPPATSVGARNPPASPKVGPEKAAPVDLATLKLRSKTLETVLLKRAGPSEKVLIQSELSYMRRQLSVDRKTVNVTYPVNPPYAFIHVHFDRGAGEFAYDVLEPQLTPVEEVTLKKIRDKLEVMMGQEELPVPLSSRLDDSEEMKEYVRTRFLRVIDLYDIDVPEKRRSVFLYYLSRDFLALGRTDAVLKDPFLEDVSCLGHGVPLYVYHRVFGSIRSNVIYPGELELNRYIVRLAQVSGKHISIYQPILDATLQDGSRINLTLGTEVTRKGSTFSIRRFSQDPVSPIDLLKFGSVSSWLLSYFWTLIEAHRSILISGGTASGKTTLLNAICMFIRPEDKIVSIEDTPEIHIDHDNWIQSVARSGYGMGNVASSASGVSGVTGGPKASGSVTLFDLLVAALRQRPEYVIVGEVRGAEAFTLFQAISVGHASMSTIHAGSIGELIHRVENEPMNIPRVLFQALDVVAFPAQVVVKDSRVRRVTGVTEILEVDPTTKELLTNDVMGWQPANDAFVSLGRSFILEKVGRTSGRTVTELLSLMKKKQEFLELLAKLNVTNFRDVCDAIQSYYVDPAEAYRSLAARRPL